MDDIILYYQIFIDRRAALGVVSMNTTCLTLRFQLPANGRADHITMSGNIYFCVFSHFAKKKVIGFR